MLEFIPFSTPTYWLNFSAMNAISSSATVGDVELAMRPFLNYVDENRDFFEEARAKSPLTFDGKFTTVDASLAERIFELNPLWCQGWLDAGEHLAKQAEEFLAKGQRFTAGNLFRRASVLVGQSEWSMQASPEKVGVYDRGFELCMRAIELAGEKVEQVRIPYSGKELHGMFWPAEGEGPMPTALCFNGLHSSMEWFWQNNTVAELRRRGISVLLFDCPGSGHARFHQNLPMDPQTEKYAGAALDYLMTRSDVDPDRIASFGCSFGGYRCVRAASVDPRFKMCLAWGALYEYQQARQKREGKPLTAPVGMSGLSNETLQWVMGAASHEEWLERRSEFTLEGLPGKMTCDLIVFHGGADMQVPLEQAERVIAEAVNTRSKELHIYARRGEGDQHCHLDNLPTALGYMTDRVASLL